MIGHRVHIIIIWFLSNIELAMFKWGDISFRGRNVSAPIFMSMAYLLGQVTDLSEVAFFQNDRFLSKKGEK